MADSLTRRVRLAQRIGEECGWVHAPSASPRPDSPAETYGRIRRRLREGGDDADVAADVRALVETGPAWPVPDYPVEEGSPLWAYTRIAELVGATLPTA